MPATATPRGTPLAAANNQPTPESVKRSSEYKDYEAWAAQCIYACRICSVEYRSDCSLIKHVRSAHGIDKFDYKEKYGSLVTQKTHFKCPACSVNVLHAVNHLSFHMKRCLNMQLFQFYRDHVVGDKPVPPSVAPPPASQPVRTNLNTGQLTPYKETKAFRIKQKQDDPEYNDWSNKCVYDCQICSGRYRSDAGLIKHIKNEHGMDKLDYKAAYGKFVTKPVYFKCPFCGMKVLHVTNHLGFHLKRCGNMSLYQFYQDHVVGDKPVIRKPKEELDTSITPSSNTPASHQPLVVSSSFDPALAGEISSWANHCEYDCQICGNKYDQDPTCLKHIINTHGLSKDEYKAQYGSFLTKKVMYDCPRCQRQVFRTKKAMAFHAKYCANASLEDFYRSDH